MNRQLSIVCLLCLLMMMAAACPPDDDDDNDDSTPADDDSVDDDSSPDDDDDATPDDDSVDDDDDTSDDDTVDDDTTDDDTVDDDTTDDDTADDDTSDDDTTDDDSIDDDSTDDDTGDDDTIDDDIVDDDTVENPEIVYLEGGRPDGEGRGAALLGPDGQPQVIASVARSLIGYSPTDKDAAPELLTVCGANPAVQVDAAGHLHLAYRTPGNDRLRYANNVSGQWRVWSIDAQTRVYYDISLALDTDGHAHISYCAGSQYGGNSLRYATNASGQWRHTVLETSFLAGQHNSIVVDSQGYAHIAYSLQDTWDLKYATNRSGQWRTFPLTVADELGRYCRIAIDDDDHLYIAYASGALDAIVIVSNTSGHWAKEIAVDGVDYPLHLSMHRSPDGIYHFGFFVWVTNKLWHATNAGGSWQKTELTGWLPDWTLGWTAITVDDYGDPYLFWGSDNIVKLQTDAGGAWTEQTIVDWNLCGEPTTMTVDNQGYVHIAYMCDDVADTVKIVDNRSGAWATQILENATVFTDNRMDLVVDDAGTRHLAYRAGYNDSLRYVTDESGSWTFANLGANGTGAAVAVRDDVVYLAWNNLDTGMVEVGDNAGGDWVFTPVGECDAQGRDLSLAVDEDGHAHVSYHKGPYLGLVYATNAGGDWTTEIVDDRVSSGKWNSLALDADGHVHLLYGYEDPAVYAGVRYATNKSGEWVTDTPDSDTGFNQYCRLAVDDDGIVHGVYYDDGVLRYLDNQGGNWNFVDLDGCGEVGRFADMFLRADGSLDFAYSGADAVWYRHLSANVLKKGCRP